MPESSSFTVRQADWRVDETVIARVRRAVFIEEQGVPEQLEWEDQDSDCVWFIAETRAGEHVGIVRLTPDGRIGRMAVLASWRRAGVGSVLLTTVLNEARLQGLPGVSLSAQTHAMPFYACFGFRAEGHIYQDAGIPHLAMSFTFQELP